MQHFMRSFNRSCDCRIVRCLSRNSRMRWRPGGAASNAHWTVPIFAEGNRSNLLDLSRKRAIGHRRTQYRPSHVR